MSVGQISGWFLIVVLFIPNVTKKKTTYNYNTFISRRRKTKTNPVNLSIHF